MSNNPFYYKDEKGMYVKTIKKSKDQNCKHINYVKIGSTVIITVSEYFKCLDCEKEIDVDYGY